MKVRIKFSKWGAMKFIGHLDIMRYFQKAIRRAGIDIAYSGGFSPHQIMSFAAPLSVGLTSKGEYFDIELRTFTSVEEIKKCLNETMVEGIDILEVTELSEKAGNAMASVAAASYILRFEKGPSLPTDWVSQFVEFYNRPSILFTKQTKKVTRELDLKPYIYDMKIMEDTQDGILIYLLVNAGSNVNIKPGFLLDAFGDSIGFSLPEFALHIERMETYGNKGTEEVPVFVPLSELA